MYHIVYLTTNLINQKIYIGKHSTNNLDDGYIGKGVAFKLAIKKYGRDNFKRQILYYCLTKEDAFELESSIVDIWFINRPDTYNIAYGGSGGFTGSHTNESKQKISDANKGKTTRIYQPLSEATKQKIKDKRKLQKFSNETREKMRTSNIGKCHTHETKSKISKANKGRTHTEEAKQKMRLAKSNQCSTSSSS